MKDQMIPEQNQGIQTNTESRIDFYSIEEAKSFFAVARQRLFSVSNWKAYAGIGASLSLRNTEGKPVSSEIPAVGQFICIDLPAPGPKAGDGHDWVRIDEVKDEEDSAGMTVHPAPSPENDNDDVAHFFHDGASSTFLVRRMNKEVIAGVYGRNEKPNTEAKGIVDTIRNAAVAAGAMTGLAKIQWKSLVNGITEPEK